MISTTGIWFRYNGRAAVPYHNNVVLVIIHRAGTDETYGTYVDAGCFDIHDYDHDTDHDTDDDTNDNTDDDADAGGGGDRRPVQGGHVHFSPNDNL